MITIVEPKEYIDKLWGKQRIERGENYRLMQYVLKIEHDAVLLLHNVVTGQLVILEQKEADVISRLPAEHNSDMDALIADHFLVPLEYDEHEQVLNLRSILQKLTDAKPKTAVTNYTILPTTACNARCYYCFEKGTKFHTMTAETANDVVKYIVENCGDQKEIVITWFGGEPTVAANRIDQISEGIRKQGVKFRSAMITNGYLFDEEMVNRAKRLWNLKSLQITVDGTEESYNKIKAYPGVKGSPYRRVMRNIGLLLNAGIIVGLRMNYDLSNYKEYYSLVEEAIERFGQHKLLSVSAHPVVGKYVNADGVIEHASDEWFLNKQVEMSNIVQSHGLRKNELKLPYMNFEACAAYNESAVSITAEGGLVRCPEQFERDQFVGTVKTGVTNRNIIALWKEVADYPTCKSCKLFPNCVRLTRCGNKSYCHKYKLNLVSYENAAIVQYEQFIKCNRNERGIKDDFSRT